MSKSRIKKLEAEVTRLRKGIGGIIDFPDEEYGRRTEDGYPEEIVYDEFAYRRLVNSYRSFGRELLGEESPHCEKESE